MEDFKELIRAKNRYISEKNFSNKIELYKEFTRLIGQFDIRPTSESFEYKGHEILQAWVVYLKGEKLGYMLDYFTKAKKIRSVGIEI